MIVNREVLFTGSPPKAEMKISEDDRNNADAIFCFSSLMSSDHSTSSCFPPTCTAGGTS